MRDNCTSCCYCARLYSVVNHGYRVARMRSRQTFLLARSCKLEAAKKMSNQEPLFSPLLDSCLPFANTIGTGRILCGAPRHSFNSLVFLLETFPDESLS